MKEAVHARWFTPRRLLVLFCVINLINYMDRGAIASNGVNGGPGDPSCKPGQKCREGTGIQGEYHLSNFQDGVLPAAFMVGLLFASPIFAELAKLKNPFRLIGVGLSVWTVAVAGCGFSFNFISLTICRMFVGVGEASFVSLAAPFIDDNAPPTQKTVWLALFYMCIPVGIALGYVFGGVVSMFATWRVAFFIEALLMLPFAVLGFVSDPIPLKGTPHSALTHNAAPATHPSSSSSHSIVSQGPEADATLADGEMSGDGEIHAPRVEQSQTRIARSGKFLLAIGKDIVELLENRIYAFNAAGAVAYTAVLGTYAYFGPKVGFELFHIHGADTLFGLITILTGVVGTLVGGITLDRMGCTIPNSFKFMAVCTFIGAIACTVAFLAPGATSFCIFLGIGEFFLFAIQGPINVVSLQCVEPHMRSMSVALSTILIHVFGDVPAPPLVGLFQDKVKNWRITTTILTSILFLSVGFFFFGSSLPTPVFEPEEDAESAHAVRDVSESDREHHSAPLLTHNGTV